MGMATRTARVREYVMKSSRHLGASISGAVFGIVSLISAVLLAVGVDNQKLTRDATIIVGAVSLILACLMFFVAQYRVWEEEVKAREKAEAELNSSPDIQGTVGVWPASYQHLYHKDGNISNPAFPVATIRLAFDCANHGMKACEISKYQIEACLDGKPFPATRSFFQSHKSKTVAHGESFSGFEEVAFPEVPAARRDDLDIKVFLVDSLGNVYKNIQTISGLKSLQATP